MRPISNSNRSHSNESHRSYDSLSPDEEVVECISIRDSDSLSSTLTSPTPRRRSPRSPQSPLSPPRMIKCNNNNDQHSIASRGSRSYSPQPRRRPPSPRSPPQQPQPSLQSLQRSPQYRTRTLSRSLSGSKYYSSEEDEEPIFRETVEPTSCLAIFGLNIYTTRHKLFDIFSKFGSIEKLQIVVDPESGRSRGFCFIYYAKMADAKTAKEVCTGSNIDQRRIRIDYSRVSRSPTAHRRRREREYDSRSPSLTRRPPSPARSERYSGKSRSSSRSSSPKNRRMRSRSRSRSRSGSRGRRPDKPPQSRCIGVFGLSVYTTQQRIREVFSKFGPIERIQVVIDAQTGRSRGFCFIYYESEADAKEAKDSCSGMELDSRRIRVDYSITERPHSPTPGVYMGRPTRSFRQREYRERYREEYRPRRYASPPPPYDFHHHHARIRYERAYEDRSMSPPRYSRHKY